MALPDAYLRKVPPEPIILAGVKLLSSEQERVIADVLADNARLLHKSQKVSFYEVDCDGVSIKIGFDDRHHRLVPYRKKMKATAPESVAAAAGSPQSAC